MKLGTIDIGKLRGVGDKFVGLSKETAGVLLGNDRLQEAGEAQQTKATETLKALRDEAQAEGDEARARALGGDGKGSGLLDTVTGTVKKATGRVAGDDQLEAEGRTEAARGSAQRSATANRATAKGHEAKAKAAETAQDAADS